MHIHIRDSHHFFWCYLQKDVNQSVWGVEATCTKFLYTKDSSFTFQVFVSQVLSCDSTWINAVVLLHFSLPLSISYHNVVCLFFLSLSCADVHVTCCMFLYFVKNITPSDVTLPSLWCMYLNKEDFFCGHSLLSFLLSSLITLTSEWMVSGCRNLCLIVFGVRGFPSRWCSLTSWRVTDSRRSLVPSPAYSAWLSGLTWISWRAIAPIFNNSRYPWKTCGNVL